MYAYHVSMVTFRECVQQGRSHLFGLGSGEISMIPVMDWAGTARRVGHVELFAMVPALTVVAATMTARWRGAGDRLRSTLQHFAAGVVFSTVAVELLPDLLRSHAVIATIAGFASGVGLLLLIRTLSREPPPSAAGIRAHVLPIGMLVALGIDILLDGLLVGLGFSIGAKEGGMITAALPLDLLSLGNARLGFSS